VRAVYKNSTWRFASRAAFHSINGCAAQDSWQLLMFEAKSCSYGRSFTMLHVHVVNS
jgi:hypothetical protein